MSAIKLYKKGTLQDGTQRFQSQLLIGKDTVDFILENNGIMRYYTKGEKGFDFYPYNEPYEIVSDINQMSNQIL